MQGDRVEVGSGEERVERGRGQKKKKGDGGEKRDSKTTTTLLRSTTTRSEKKKTQLCSTSVRVYRESLTLTAHVGWILAYGVRSPWVQYRAVSAGSTLYTVPSIPY